VTADGGVVATATACGCTSTRRTRSCRVRRPSRALDLRFASDAELVARHTMRKFSSQGFPLWRNGDLVAIAVDFDAGCKSVAGMVTGGKGLRDGATPIEHHIDVRATGQDYFGPCDRPRPEPLTFPAP
jgi:hypothetical protein